MSQRKDKPKVVGEVFDNERIKGFLNHPPPEGVSQDYHLLVKAYRGMREENFHTFIQFFLEAGYNINALGPDGQTFLQNIKHHDSGGDYLQALKNAGAH